jgi:hypothetical protein
MLAEAMPVETRKERIQAQIRRVLRRHRSLRKLQLYNKLTCDVSFDEFKEALTELVGREWQIDPDPEQRDDLFAVVRPTS